MNNREDAQFYDKSALIKDIDNLIRQRHPFVISSFTLYDLENNPTEENKDVLKKLIMYKPIWTDWFYPEEDKVNNRELAEILCAANYDQNVRPDETIFITGSYTSHLVANRYFGYDSIKYIK